MAMVRTIQHPGVQIQETEIGNYTNTVVMNNAYIMGFTDKGPIYDYSFITTTSEFTRIYGEPQTEAEKYLFIAVQSVLTNGGTPIVARIPYDNKQCKAYKALKMTWIDKTDLISPIITTDLATPIVPLSALTNEIKTDRSFAEIFDNENVSINNKIDEESKKIVDSITIAQATMLLNPYKSGSANSDGSIYKEIADLTSLKINDVYPSAVNIGQEAVSSLVESISHDAKETSIDFYQYDAGFNKVLTSSKEEIENKFIKGESNVIRLKNNYLSVTHKNENGVGEYTTLISLYDDVVGNTTYENYPVINKNEISENIYTELSAASLLSGYDYSIKKNKKDDRYELTFNSINGILNFKNAVTALSGNITIKESDVDSYFDFTANEKYYTNTTIDNLPVYNKADYEKIENRLTNIFAIKDNIISGNIISGMNETVTTINGLSGSVVMGKTSDIKELSSEITIDNLIPVYEGTVNGYLSGKFITTSSVKKLTLLGFVHNSLLSPAVSGTITFRDGQDSEYKNLVNAKPDQTYKVIPLKDVSKSEFSEMINPNKTQGPMAWNLTNFSDFYGESDHLRIVEKWRVTYETSLGSVYIKDVDDDLIYKNDWLAAVKTIYNNPMFSKFDERHATLLEAKLMNTPEMNFKYGLYLDSEDCEISNDQYDNLVTINKFSPVDKTVDKYGQNIDDANFIIVDKQKSVVQGPGGNIGFFTTIIDPFDGLKVQRTLVNPADNDPSVKIVSNSNSNSKTITFDHSEANINSIDYWAYESANKWNTIYDELLDSMDCLQRVRNADGVYIGEPSTDESTNNIFSSWSIPLTGSYYNESISKTLMRKFPGIAMADISVNDLSNPNYTPSIIDHDYCTHICVAVCQTTIDQTNGKIVVNLIETHFGSLFDERNPQNGRSLFIGDIINANSDYIEFYRNDFITSADNDYAPSEYRSTPVNQIFIKDSPELKNAASLRGMDWDDYGCNAIDKETRENGIKEYYADLEKFHIWAIDKNDVCIYNLHWEANLTSFSKKESQKVIANTNGLYSVNDGTTVNIANNFLIDIDRCIKFVKNIDEIPLHFVCDAGLSTIAQFCDNVVWNPKKKTMVSKGHYETTGGWITQPFDPNNDPNGEDRYITSYDDVYTWRKVAEKIISIASEIRKDCFAIIDAPRQLTLDGAAPKIRRSKFNNNFDKTIGKCLRYISGINTSYAAGYYNWLRTTDQYTGVSMWIPPTTKLIGNYCYLNIINRPWLAPAGLTYGLISGCHGVSHNPDAQEEDQIYMKSWNYIKQYPYDGLVVEGQKTLLGKESVFERVNVRLLFLDLERFTYNVSRTFKYQVNNSYTREQFVATLKPKFEDYTIRGGIYEYFIKVDSENNTPETIDQNELRGDIFIKPARLIEFILLNFVGTSTSTNFSELQLG